MKILFLLLLTLLLAAPAHALPRRQHLLEGKIIAVDSVSHTFTVESATSGLVTVTWNDTTKLRDGKLPATATALAPGRTVSLYYRAEVGVKNAREITLQPSSPPASGQPR